MGRERCRFVWHHLLKDTGKNLLFDSSGPAAGSGLTELKKCSLCAWEKFKNPPRAFLLVLSKKTEWRISKRDLLEFCDSQTTDRHWKFIVLNSDLLWDLHQDLELGQHWMEERKSGVRRMNESCVLHSNTSIEPGSSSYEPFWGLQYRSLLLP